MSHRLPAVVDVERFNQRAPAAEPAIEFPPTFVYCGTWLNDINFLIEALALMKQSGYDCRLKLIGGSLEQCGAAIMDFAAQHGLSDNDVVLAR